MNYKITIFTPLILSLCLLTGCSKHLQILVCPIEYSEQISVGMDLGTQREILFKANYETLVVSRNKNNKILPVQHFRRSHTFGKITPLNPVTWAESLHVSTILVIKKTNQPLGIAIKKNTEIDWKIYWLENINQLDSSNDINVIYLPPLSELETVREIPSSE